MQGISFEFVSYQRSIRKVLAWSHYNHKFFSGKVFYQMCFKRSGRCEYTAQIPPLLQFSCLQSIQGSDYIFKLKTYCQGPALVFSLDAIITAWDDRIIRITILVLLFFSQEVYHGGNLSHFIRLNGDSALMFLMSSRNAWPRDYSWWKVLKQMSWIQGASFSCVLNSDWKVSHSSTVHFTTSSTCTIITGCAASVVL